MAAVPGSGLTVKHETFTPSYNISPMSGYSPALSVGDFGFVPGQTAEARENCNADGACFRNATLVQAAATPRIELHQRPRLRGFRKSGLGAARCAAVFAEPV